MDFRFELQDLEDLYTGTSDRYARRFPTQVVEAFFLVMAEIDAAVDERDLRALKSRHYEKVPSEGEGVLSMRLNRQFRLLFRKDEEDGAVWITILAIRDYH